MSMLIDDDGRFDGLYLNVAQTTRGIEPLLDTVFSFLRRKTDFFAGPPGAENGSAAAIAKVNEVLHKHAKRYENDQKEKRQHAPQKAKAKTVQPQQPFKKTEPKEENEEIIELGIDGFDVSDSSTSQKPIISPLKVSHVESSKEQKPKKVDVEKDKDGSNLDDNNKEDDDDDLPPPGNGGVNQNYEWTQTLAEVNVTIAVPSNTRGRDVQVTISRSHLRISLKKMQNTVVDDDLTKPIICDDSFWTIEDGNRLVVTLQKLNQMEWWEAVCKGDPIINVRKIRPENSNLSDLDGETRKTVEKMMFDQRQKTMGLPTSDEQTKLDALDMFKKQHPEMDFSNAKVSWNWGESYFF